MNQISLTNKIGISTLLFACLATASFNREGLQGVDRTHSAQTLGHAHMGIGVLGNLHTDAAVFENSTLVDANGNATVVGPIAILEANPFVSMGIGNYTDLSLVLPLNYESINPEGKFFGLGDVKALVKVRLPVKGGIADYAILVGMHGGTTHAGSGGMYPRTYEAIKPGPRTTLGYGPGELLVRGHGLITLDFRRLEKKIPVLWHLNGGYRQLVDGSVGVMHLSSAMEWLPVEFVDVYGAVDFELPNNWPQLNGVDEKLTLATFSGGGVLHTPVGVDFHLGASLGLIGSQWIRNMTQPQHNYTYGVNTTPALAVYGGITWTGLLTEKDTDGDGVIDSKDRCIDKAGPAENEGCPLPEPDLDKDGLCDPWVAERGMLPRYAGVCEGIDKCPNEVGPLDNEGCSLANPDQDKDSVCDPWVSEKGLLEKFAETCKGHDKCPAEPGPDWFNGCPVPNPDVDGDGICDAWVTEQNLIAQFADQCRGLDKCPAEKGLPDNDGCPLPDPDLDKDGVCDPWVSEKGMLPKYAAICKGLDKCPNKAGSIEMEGCPTKPIEKQITLKGVNFKTGTADLTFESRKILDAMVEQLLDQKDVELEVRGHTDNVGNAASNMELSRRRAQSIVDYFVLKGVAPARLRATGFGDEQPVESNKTASGRSANRRVEIYRLK